MSLRLLSNNDDVADVIDALDLYANNGSIKQILVLIPGFSNRAGIMVYHDRGVPVYGLTSNAPDISREAANIWNLILTSSFNSCEIANNFTTRSKNIILATVCDLMMQCANHVAQQ